MYYYYFYHKTELIGFLYNNCIVMHCIVQKCFRNYLTGSMENNIFKRQSFKHINNFINNYNCRLHFPNTTLHLPLHLNTSNVLILD